MAQNRVLVAGDMMIDLYCMGNVQRISPEAPVPVFRITNNNDRKAAGGAANVAVNIKATGVEVDILSVIGKDAEGKTLLQILNDIGINTEYIIEDLSRHTTVKRRYLGQNNQQLLRVDYEDDNEISLEICEKAIEIIEKQIGKYQAVLVSDYKKGFLTHELVQALIKNAASADIPVIIDVKDKESAKYSGATILKPNRSELAGMTDLNVDSIDEVATASMKLLKDTHCNYVLTTLGADGMLLVNQKGVVKQYSSVAKEVYDVTGAGDTVAAYLASEIAQGIDIMSAVEKANYAAGVQVSKVGTSTVYPHEVMRAMNFKDSLHEKFLNEYQMCNFDFSISRRGKVVFTNGCFDILHAGHVTYLNKAKEMGDILVVGVNSDASVRRLKGERRPINTLADRMLVLAALECVDYIIPFEDGTPLELIHKVKPDILVKGGDYNIENIAGADFVQEYGGIVTTIPLLEGKSTTNIVKQIQE